ncbi:MAG: heterodisulfide reductase-related iron-sulfur binding cluster, partial [Brachymonas sp.]|nr:heterodisulfide reductase-related iron-sulfur binding cluster [Brachymonas sp.]
CCGAVDYHLNAQQAGLQHARRSVDAWWQQLQNGAEAIVQTASGCGAFVKEYAALLHNDPLYADKARLVAERSLDLVEVLEKEPLDALHIQPGTRLAFHCPCTLQHALKLTGRVEALLRRCGFDLTAVPDSHLCCGSAGTYSITQPALSAQLRAQKMDALESGNPARIATANIGCQTHLNAAGRTPVQHWIEVLDAHMRA